MLASTQMPRFSYFLFFSSSPILCSSWSGRLSSTSGSSPLLSSLLFFCYSLSVLVLNSTLKVKERTSRHFSGKSVTASRYAVSKSTGLSWYRISQDALERTRAGIKVYFCVTTMIDIVPLKIICLRFITNCASLGSNSAFFICPTTSSRTTRTFLCVRSWSGLDIFLSSSYFFWSNLLFYASSSLRFLSS